MKYRDLGRTGIKVSEIGFGAWGIGGATGGPYSYGPTDDDQSRRALRKALDLGVTFYDTADIYGYGHSETLLGSTFRGVRQQVVIASKVGYLRHDGPQDFSPEYLRISLEGSLLRLRTDYVDIYQLHDPSLALLRSRPDILGALYDLKQEGKLRAFGISARSPSDGVAAVRDLSINIVQTNFSMIDQRALDAGLFATCRAHGAAVICRTPFAFGFLTGRYSITSTFGPDDHRSVWPQEQRDLWATAFDQFAAVIDMTSQSKAQVALRFCLSHDGVATVIPGMLSHEEVVENTRASGLGPLPGEVCSAIRRIYEANSFFIGPVRKR